LSRFFCVNHACRSYSTGLLAKDMIRALRSFVAGISRWIDDAALALSRLGGIFRATRKVQLVEQTDGEFVVRAPRRGSGGAPIGAPMRIEEGRFVEPIPAKIQKLVAGGQVEIMLKPAHFVFRPLELPRRAGEFLDGVVRAQIDRLTPWSPGDSAFGYSRPTPVGADRIVVTVAATARSKIAPFVQALASRGADSIVVSTFAEGGDGRSAPIAIFAHRAGAELRVLRLRRRLVAVLVLASAALEHRVVGRVAALRTGRDAIAEQGLAALEAKKAATPAGVIVLEALSQTLPDDTYLNEMRIQDGKVQIAGLTRDAPALIRLIEQSQHFTHAAFFAPTTRAPDDNGERFHIEAHIEPTFPAPQ
jgi:general secretion pathway protein L